MGSGFFARLAGTAQAPAALAAFERSLGRPLALAPYPFFPLLYHTLLTHLLGWLDLARSPGSLRWEWRPLYQLEQETDPFYFSEDHVTRRLQECPPLTPVQQDVLNTVLTGYFALRRSGVLQRVPVSAVPGDSLVRRWVELFPAALAWRSLDVLKAIGLYPVGSPGGYRSYARFRLGRFVPDYTPHTLREWQALCAQEGAAAADAGRDAATASAEAPLAQQADFLAAAFAGELTALGLAGVCGDVPRCDQCPLRMDCRWANAQPQPASSPAAELAALARRGALEFASLPDLLRGLFDSPEGESAGLRERLAGVSLRTLSGKTLPELEDWLGPLRPGPEKLLLLFELCRRFSEERLEPGVAFVTGWDIFRHFRIRLRDLKQEQFIVVLLDVKKRFLGDMVISQGGLDSSPVHPREVFSAAIRERAAYVLLVHNHPSGDPTPSQQDVQATRSLAEAGRLLRIPVLDHVIVASDKYLSLRESNLVEF